MRVLLCVVLVVASASAIHSQPDQNVNRNIIGEKTIEAIRPHQWTVEWDGKEGLCYNAYSSRLRAPYIQNVRSKSAELVWRVGVPIACNPFRMAKEYWADVWIEEDGIEISENRSKRYKVRMINGDVNSKIRVVANKYKYKDGVRYNSDAYFGNKYWLDSYTDRPVLQAQLKFTSLKPGRVYHYRVKSLCKKHPNDNEWVPTYLAWDAYFRAAPRKNQNSVIRFVAMGDLGPGDGQPSYFYDVFDLFHDVVRQYSPDLWLILGDIDNDTDGHPNAYDPFFFNVYNAYHNTSYPRYTSNEYNTKKGTRVKAFRDPPYYGILSGLPAYPTFGNHDICTSNDGSKSYFDMAYRSSFLLPQTSWSTAATRFNESGNGFYYTMRFGDVIFISLGIPKKKCCVNRVGLRCQEEWTWLWGRRQYIELKKYLVEIEEEVRDTNVWIVVYMHDYSYAVRLKSDYSYLFTKYGVDLVLAGHDHSYYYRDVRNAFLGTDYRAVVIGTGGFGDSRSKGGDYCTYPGFVLFEVKGDELRYWKYDTHLTKKMFGVETGRPFNRDAIANTCRNEKKIIKIKYGQHEYPMW